MSNYYQDYVMAPNEVKLEILQTAYKYANTKEEKRVLTKETQRIYNIIKRRNK